MSKAQTNKFITLLKRSDPTSFLGTARLLEIPVWTDSENGEMRPIAHIIIDCIAKFDTLPKRLQKEINALLGDANAH